MTTDDRRFADRFSLFVKQTFKYYLVGASGVGIGLDLLYLLTDIVGIWYVISQSIAIGIAIGFVLKSIVDTYDLVRSLPI